MTRHDARMLSARLNPSALSFDAVRFIFAQLFFGFFGAFGFMPMPI